MTAHLETIMPTLSDLRRALDQALTHSDNLAILRLPENERTVEGLARAYMPRHLSRIGDYLAPEIREFLAQGFQLGGLDLSDPGTCHAVLVALALALGLDPGVGGLGVFWCQMEGASYRLGALSGNVFFTRHEWTGNLYAPSIAAEPDPIKALALAVRHVLDEKESPCP